MRLNTSDVHGGVSVVAAGLQLIAKGGLLQDDPDDQGDDNGQEETNIHVENGE